MPPGKRSKEQTWKEAELKDTLKEINDERARDGKSRRKREDGDEKSKHESSQRRSDKDRDRDRSDRDRRDRDREKPKDSNRDRDERKNRDDKDREKRHRDDKDRDRDRKREDDKRDRDRKERDKDGDRKHRDERGDRERRHRDEEDRDKRDDDKKRRDDRDRRHRDDDKDRKRRDEDRDRSHRDDKDRGKDRDREKERDKDRERRHKDDRGGKPRDDHKDDRERRHRDDKDRDRRHRDEDGDKKHRDDRDKRHRDDERDRDHRKRDDKDRRDDGDRRRRHEDDKRREERVEKKESSSRDADRDKRHRDDRDKEKHSKRRDEEESERRRKEEDKNRSSRQSDEVKDKSKSSKRKEEPEKIEEVKRAKPPSAKSAAKDEEEEDDYGGYDDDFEDYDDDFEDDDGEEAGDETQKFNKMVIYGSLIVDRDCMRPGKSKNKRTNREMEDLFEALNEENDRLLSDSRRSNWSDSTEDDRQMSSNRPITGKPRSFVNFVAAKQRDMNQKVANKARKRCTELLNIIELDTVHITLFDLPPVKEYDLYMSSFGRTNAQQAYVQTNDDNLDRDIQTDEIETKEMWCQHPQEGSASCGGDNSNNAETYEGSAANQVDDVKLSSFLQRACQVVERLINEEHGKSSYTEKASSFSCSEAYTGLRKVGVFKSRQVSQCHYSNTDSSMLLTMHTEPSEEVDKKLDKYGMIGVWNTNDASQPQKIVASASIPSCCCFSPVKATLVFGGMRDGSLVAWDLREPPTMHHSYICGGQDWLLRFPTYNTAGVLKYDNHNSPITAIVPILQENKKPSASESGLGLSFQLATLDKTGIINLWVVAEMLETSMAGSESDLGLSPNGRIKLLKSSSLTLNSPVKNDLSTSLCTLDLKLNSVNHNHLYVTTDAGIILHSTRFGTQKTVPRCYMSDDSTPCVVTSIDLHPFGHPVLLAGYEDGSLRLFHLSTESPIITWESATNGAAVRRVLWSRNCAYIIFVLDANSTIHMWDLLRNDAEPMTSDQVIENGKRLVDMCLSEQDENSSRPKMVLCYEDGTTQVHLLSSHVSNLQPGENEQFARFVEQL